MVFKLFTSIFYN